MEIPAFEIDPSDKVVSVVLPEGWRVLIDHESNEAVLNVVGLSGGSCVVRTPTSPVTNLTTPLKAS